MCGGGGGGRLRLWLFFGYPLAPCWEEECLEDSEFKIVSPDSSLCILILMGLI